MLTHIPQKLMATVHVLKKHSVFKYANGQAMNEMVNISIIRDVKLIETLIS